MNEESHLHKADKVEIKESEMSEQPLAPVLSEPDSSEQPLAPVLNEPVAKQVLQEIDEIRKSLPKPGNADPFNPKLDKGTRLLLFLYVAGLGAFGSWFVTTGSPYFTVSTFVVGTLILLLIGKTADNRLEELFLKNPVGMKLVVGLSGIVILLAVWLLMRLIFAVLGLPVDK